MAISVTVTHVFADVGDGPVCSIFANMVVDPSQENLLIIEFINFIVFLIWFLEQNDLWVVLKRDFARNIDLILGRVTLMICQIRPKTMCSRFSMIS